MIYSHVETIGPEKAALYLQSNTQNRNLRKTAVTYLSAAMKRGEWRLTHQGLAFSASGRLLDGQHRLSAIIEAGVEVPMMVTQGLPEDAFMALDRGVARTTADALRISPRDVEVYTLASRIADERAFKSRRMTPDQVEAWALVLGEPLTELTTLCPTFRKFFSQAAMRLAAVLHVIDGGNKDYVFNLYRDLVVANGEKLPLVGHSLVKQVTNGTATSKSGDTGQIEGLARGYVVFDESKKDIRRIQVDDTATATAWAAKILNKAMAGKMP